MFFVVPRAAIEDVAASMPLPGAVDWIVAHIEEPSAVDLLAWHFFAARFDRDALADIDA